MLGLWLRKTLLATTVWEQRNKTAHSDGSIAEKIEQSQYTRELTEWKSDRHTRLRLSATWHNLFGYIIMKSMYMWSNFKLSHSSNARAT